MKSWESKFIGSLKLWDLGVLNMVALEFKMLWLLALPIPWSEHFGTPVEHRTSCAAVQTHVCKVSFWVLNTTEVVQFIADKHLINRDRQTKSCWSKQINRRTSKQTYGPIGGSLFIIQNDMKHMTTCLHNYIQTTTYWAIRMIVNGGKNISNTWYNTLVLLNIQKYRNINIII